MKKRIAILICLALLTLLALGCSGGKTPEPAEPEPGGAESTDEPGQEPEQQEEESHYVFQPKVCSSYMKDLFGETMRDAWYCLVDAVMAGEDHFACPDVDTYLWVMGQFPEQCFPVLGELIDYSWDPDHYVTDGMAVFTYTVPPEEAAARIAEFAELVEDILNENLKDDYSDLEKALALYRYFSNTYVYDHEAAAAETVREDLSSYRVLTTGTGICGEISGAYSYLLLQAGVDANNMSGHRSWDCEPHQWSYVCINGHSFHIDPTYALGERTALTYFMMDDDQREAEDGYLRDDWIICSNYAQDHPHREYTADDDSFRAVWRGVYIGFDHETRTLYYEVDDGTGSIAEESFDYTGW